MGGDVGGDVGGDGGGPDEMGDLFERTERWFIARGTPHFIDDYSPSRDVFTRTLPALTLVVVVEVVGALNARWDWWQNALAVAAAVGLLGALWAAINLVRGRPARTRPQRVGTVELTMFVVGPALLPLVFGGQVAQAFLVAGANVALLGAVYAVTSYGIVALARWATARMFRELGTVFGLLVRALPLLLLFITFLFLNTEVWQVASTLEAPFLVAVVGLFLVLGGGFLFTHLPAEIGRLGRFDSVAQVVDLCRGTPVAPALAALTDAQLEAPPLTRRQRGNVVLVVVVSEAIQVTLVALLIAAFFVVFGLVAIRPTVIESWTGAPGDVLWGPEVFGERVVLTAELLRVATFLGAFSGFYFTVYVITDATYRAQFFDEVVADVRQGLAVRTAYLGALSRRAP